MANNMTNDIIKLTATELAEKIRKRELSSVEATGAFLERITALEPKVKAFISVLDKEALVQAGEIDKLITSGKDAGLLAGVWGDARKKSSAMLSVFLAVAAIFSVAWWHFTEQIGAGDLRPYLLLQALPIVLIPLWQWIYNMPRIERWAFGGGLILYVIAKFAELNDHEIAAVFGVLTGHTLKHLLATGATAVIVTCLVRRVSAAMPVDSGPVVTSISASVHQ